MDSHYKYLVYIPGARAVPEGGARSQRGSLCRQSGLHRYEDATHHSALMIVHSEQLQLLIFHICAVEFTEFLSKGFEYLFFPFV